MLCLEDHSHFSFYLSNIQKWLDSMFKIVVNLYVESLTFMSAWLFFRESTKENDTHVSP